MSWDSTKVTGNVLEAAEWNTMTAYIKALIPDHTTAYNHTKLHTRQHAINAAVDHTGVPSATENNYLSFNASGLPKDSGDNAASFDVAGAGAAAVAAHQVTYDHASYDSHLADTTIHFTESSIDHRNIQYAGTNTHAQIDSHIASNHVNSFNTRTGAVVPMNNDYTWAQINKTTSNIADITTKSHTSLTDIGTKTHAQIDTHLNSNHVNSFNTRTGAVTPANNDYTWAQVNKATSSIADITTKTHALLGSLNADDHAQYILVDGTRAFIGAVGGITPTSTSHLATKGYVDGLIHGLDWQDSVLSRYDPTGGLPGTPSTGDRYISTATANSWTDKYIYEYNGASWDEIIPNKGYATEVEDESKYYNYNGTAWVKFGSTISHDVLLDVSADDHHNQQHAIDSATDHTSSITQNNLMDADANGLPDDSGISVTNVNAAITHITSDGSDHTFIDQSVVSGAAPAFLATNLSDGGGNAIITTTQETNFETAYTHSQIVTGNPHSVTLDQAFDAGKIIDGANSEGNAFVIGNGSDAVSLWSDGAEVFIQACAKDLVLKTCTSDKDLIFRVNTNGDTNDLLRIDASAQQLILRPYGTVAGAGSGGFLDVSAVVEPSIIMATLFFDLDYAAGSGYVVGMYNKLQISEATAANKFLVGIYNTMTAATTMTAGTFYGTWNIFTISNLSGTYLCYGTNTEFPSVTYYSQAAANNTYYGTKLKSGTCTAILAGTDLTWIKYGLHLDGWGLEGVAASGGTQVTTKYDMYSINGANWAFRADDQKLLLGAAEDASIYYDGINLVIDPKEVGSGFLSLLGSVQLDTNEKVYLRDSAIGIYSQADTFMDLFADGGIRIGDSSAGAPTNYTSFSPTGDLIFVGTSGMVFGEMWVLGNAVATAIGVAGTFVQFTGFSTNGQSNNTTPDHTNDHITVTITGKYLVVCSFHIESVGGGAADVVSIEVRKNNGTVTFSNLHAHRKLAGGGGDIGSISISGMAALTANDTVEIWLTNDDNATNILVADANLTLVQAGG